jgi:phosphoinositide-3-kinase regulatory subunit 4
LTFLSLQIKILECSCKGEFGAFSLIDQSFPENYLVLSKVRALMVPPLSPNLGIARSGFDTNLTMKQHWRPKEDILLATTSSATEHSGPVTKLAVHAEEAFFVSASSDGTSKVFELGQMKDAGGDLRSCLTYNGHIADDNASAYVRINDVTILQNNHTVASAASDGSVHVWRIDTVTSQSSTAQTTKTRVSGSTALKQVHPGEGEVMAISHFNTASASILTYATQRGIIHSMDLRSPSEPFSMNFGPEYGYLTAMELGKDRGWIAVGSSRGYVGLFDIRFQSMVKLWRHSRQSPINCLSNACNVSSWPLLFMGCDDNEAALFDASTGECRQCYRVLEGSLSYIDQAALPLDRLSMPYLEDVKVGKATVTIDSALQMITNRAPMFNVNALVGDINRNGTSHLITGGSDNMIRYWDLGRSTKSFCITGLARNQPAPSFDHMDVGRTSRLYICQQPPVPPSHLMESNKMPLQNRQGTVRCENRHSDSILDLKVINYPSSSLLSASRDGTIKLWS